VTLQLKTVATTAATISMVGEAALAMVRYHKSIGRNSCAGWSKQPLNITEGLWDKVLSAVQKGDYVFIQFGHNDSAHSIQAHVRAFAQR
jgi:hypothetical protein